MDSISILFSIITILYRHGLLRTLASGHLLIMCASKGTRLLATSTGGSWGTMREVLLLLLLLFKG